MKNIFKVLFALTIALFLVSCDKDEDRAVLGNPSDSSLSASATSLVLTKDNADETAVTFSLENPNYGVQLSQTDQLEFAIAGTNFETPKVVQIAAGENEISYTVQQFNALMLNMALPVDVVTPIEVRLKSTVGNLTPVYSTKIQMSVTPYALISYLYAPGAYQNWEPATANTLISATSNGIYEGFIHFSEANSEFKITVDRNWENGYGSNDNISLLLNGGGNLKAVNEGSQKLTVNLNTQKFALTPYVWGIIGSGSPGGWDNDTDLKWNETAKKWEIGNVALTAGEIKFRLNHDWGTNYGGSNGFLALGGDNISVSVAGNYNISLDLVNLTYTLTKL
ncbi:SusE domain-containing protein [Kaistella carnis]|uniref:DUF5116 domain-containing protein n=1 Tax=Kaistella carnis TaxID=1241979 RepID=A0A3G8XES3_9FLAO|nr:SusE domain-containing protein [Kaistella carnis]AZI31659.1 DUF5116 domain-containing protein [Kaistella carnis]